MRKQKHSMNYMVIACMAMLLLWSGPGFKSNAFAQELQPSDKVLKWKALPDEDKAKLRQTYRLWKDLNDDEKQTIRGNYSKFKAYSQDEQRKVMQNYKHLMNMDSSQRNVVLERYKKWMNMSSEQKEVLKKRYQMLMNMHPEEQAQFYDNYEAWKRLTAEQKQDLLSTLNSLSPSRMDALLSKYQEAFSPERREALKRALKQIRKDRLERDRGTSGKDKPRTGSAQ
ncbi:MAG: DUF3106 domain-containing protein [Pseudomonadota bacterium]